MNKTAIRNFAVWARNKLINDVTYRAGLMGVTANGIADPLPQSTDNVQFFDIGMAEPYQITGEEIKQRKSLVEIIKRKEKDSDYATAFTSVVEEVSYTWFNRLIAIRFMEVNDYLPSHVRVLSSESGRLEPDLVTTPYDAEMFFENGEERLIQELKNENKLDEVFRLLFIKQCNALYNYLPGLFENISDYTELLLSVSYIDQEGIVFHLIHDISEEDFDVELGGQVEIIGWLYQFYIAEPKEELINAHKKYKKSDIPFVTQLFTPDWIVKFIVENSLGRFWKEHHKDYSDENWKFYIENDATTKTESMLPEDIKFMDPCMGSGHILVYAFDVLMDIYESAGWSQRDAAVSIIENNLYGLDIDQRAAQIAYFAIMMKGRKYNRRILDSKVNNHLYEIKESNNFDRQALSLLNEKKKELACFLLSEFSEAKQIGSLLYTQCKREELIELKTSILEIDIIELNIVERMYLRDLLDNLIPIIDVALALSEKYHSVATNPPYLNSSVMPEPLKNYISSNFKDFKNDMFASFVKRVIDIVDIRGHMGFLTPYVWMFLSSFEKMRLFVYSNCSISTCVQLEYNAFEAACVPVAAFTLIKDTSRSEGDYIRLSSFRGASNQEPKTLEAINNKNCGYRFKANQNNFAKIPGMPVAYWISNGIYETFEKNKQTRLETHSGLTTGNNDKYLKLWFEISKSNLYFEKQLNDRKSVWYPHLKGGEYRKWYGDYDYVLHYDSKSIEEMKKLPGFRHDGKEFFFKKSITWGKTTTGPISARINYENATFNTAGCCMFVPGHELYVLATINSNVSREILSLLCPSLSYAPGDVAKLPIKIAERERVEYLSSDSVSLSKDDWDSFETSWDFKKHPLI